MGIAERPVYSRPKTRSCVPTASDSLSAQEKHSSHGILGSLIHRLCDGSNASQGIRLQARQEREGWSDLLAQARQS